MNKEIKTLKEYFRKQPAVILAFLFGSYAQKIEKKESDFDVAVYFENTNDEEKIWFEVSKITKKDVDLVCLNNAPASLVSNVFKTGIPLKIKDKELYWELYLRVSSEAEDFLEFVEDFWDIYKKAKSLTPEIRTKILERFHFPDNELKEIDRFKRFTFNEYKEDKDKRRIIERWVECIINATIDIAKIVLACENKRMPRSYEEALFDFALLVGFNAKEAEEFSKFASLRNILTHEYLDILYRKIQRFTKEFPKFYKKVFAFLEEYLKK